MRIEISKDAIIRVLLFFVPLIIFIVVLFISWHDLSDKTFRSQSVLNVLTSLYFWSTCALAYFAYQSNLKTQLAERSNQRLQEALIGQSEATITATELSRVKNDRDSRASVVMTPTGNILELINLSPYPIYISKVYLSGNIVPVSFGGNSTAILNSGSSIKIQPFSNPPTQGKYVVKLDYIYGMSQNLDLNIEFVVNIGVNWTVDLRGRSDDMGNSDSVIYKDGKMIRVKGE